MTPNPLCLRLSQGLVRTSGWALPNCNLVLNYAGSPRCFLRWNVQDGKLNLLHWKLARGLICNLLLNGWHTTWGTQLGIIATASHVPALRLACLQYLLNISLSLMVPNLCLTFLSITCIPFISNLVYSLVHVYHWAISLWLHECFLVPYLVP
jgi:hypothetical protein